MPRVTRSGQVKGCITGLSLLAGAALLAGCSAIDLLNATSPVGRTRAAEDIAYAADERQRLDVYRPAAGTAQPAPVVVFFYGGRWSSGAKEDYAFVGAALARQGIVVVIPDYRVFPQVRFPAFVEDGAAAVRWTRDRIAAFGGDPDAIHVMGHSAGAHIAALLTLDRGYLGDEPRLAGMVGLAGPYDFLPLKAADLRTIFGPPERFPLSQPIEYARGDAPPMLLLHGLDDDTVWPSNSRNLAAAIDRQGGRVETHFYPDIDHAEIVGALSGLADFLAPVRAEVVAFIQNGLDAQSRIELHRRAAVGPVVAEPHPRRPVPRGQWDRITNGGMPHDVVAHPHRRGDADSVRVCRPTGDAARAGFPPAERGPVPRV